MKPLLPFVGLLPSGCGPEATNCPTELDDGTVFEQAMLFEVEECTGECVPVLLSEASLECRILEEIASQCNAVPPRRIADSPPLAISFGWVNSSDLWIAAWEDESRCDVIDPDYEDLGKRVVVDAESGFILEFSKL